jgi:Phytanoyl-CoA dioxygenase (PhyH)
VTSRTTLARSAARDLTWKLQDLTGNGEVTTGRYTPSEEDKKHWDEHGWIVLKNSVKPEAIDALREEIEAYRRRSSGGRDEHGYGVRIGLLHAENRQSLEIALNQQVRDFLSWAFGGDPVLFGSLTFDVGTEQEPHIDAAFFNTEPDHGMCGVWTALEDIHPDSGPLFYVDGSHKFPRLTAPEVLEKNPELAERVRKHRESGAPPDGDLADEVYKAYSQEVLKRLEDNGAEMVPALLDKGDVFIWHGWIIHGGLPRKDRSKTRRSMVVHYVREGSKMWEQNDFFLRGDMLDQIQPVAHSLRSSKGRKYVKHHAAVDFGGGDGHFEA